MNSPDGFLQVVDLDEEQAVTPRRIDDHALLVSELVRVALQVHVFENVFPPLRQLESVFAVDGRVRYPRNHERGC